MKEFSGQESLGLYKDTQKLPTLASINVQHTVNSNIVCVLLRLPLSNRSLSK